MIRRFALCLFCFCLTPAFSNISNIERSPGKISFTLTADTLRVETVDGIDQLSGNRDLVKDRAGHTVPVYSFSLFLNDPKDARISVSVKKQAKVALKSPLSAESQNSITLNSKYLSDILLSQFRDAPLYYAHITPVMDISNSVVTQFTEARVTISYTPVRNRSIPKGDYYRAVASAALNPAEFNLKKTEPQPEQMRAIRSAAEKSYLDVDEQALKITIKPDDLKNSTAETDGSLDRMVRITPDMITGIGLNVNINDISVFSSNPFVFDSITPADYGIPPSLLPVSVIRKDKNGNGLFEPGDEILFYAQGANFWFEDRKKWAFHFNNYCEYRNYYITIGGGAVPMSKVVQPAPSGVIKGSALNLMRFKKNSEITTPVDEHIEVSKDWVWKSLKLADNTFSDLFSLFFNEDITEESFIRINNPNASRELNSKCRGKLKFSSGSETVIRKDSIASYWHRMPPQTSSFSLTINGVDTADYFDLGSYDLKYFHHLNMQGLKTLRFYSSAPREGEEVITYKITNIPAEFTTIVRVNSKLQMVELVDTLSAGGTYSFTDSVGAGYEYVVSTASGVLSDLPSLVSSSGAISSEYVVRNLHDMANRSDYMIVTPSVFLSQGVQFAAHKKRTGRFQHPTVVTTEDIYREFSGGIPNPAAIRNFMVYVHEKWRNSETDYLLLLGNGHYDYKGINSEKPNYIYPYITEDNVCVEDFYTCLTPGRTAGKESTLPSLAVGRVPGNSAADISAYLNKLKAMESGHFSEWRNVVTLVADDDIKGNGERERLKHWLQSDSIGDTILSQSCATRIKKITLFEYPFNGNKKPDANVALINAVNSGTGILNYFGHGGYNAMADERIFEFKDIDILKNYNKYMVYLAFSCSVGFFDLPGQECIAGKLVVASNRGAIASIASTRTSQASSNKKLAEDLFKKFYSYDEVNTIGSSYIYGKKESNNLRYYAIFGDPSYRPLAANRRVDVDIMDLDGNSVDTMKALQRVRVLADIPAGHKVDSVRFQLENPEIEVDQRKDGRKDAGKDTVTYTLPGSIILNQAYPVVNGRVDNIITVPLPVVQRTEGTKLRIYGWCKDAPQTVSGIKTGLYFDGLDESNIDTTDKTGPSIVIKLRQDENLADTLPGAVGNRVVINGFTPDSTSYEPKPAFVELYFSDNSGIDIFGENAGQGITVSLKGIRPAKNHNSDFISIGSSSNKGKVSLSFKQSEFPVPGEYELVVTARDYLQNSTQERFILDVRSLGDGVYDIGDFYALPSPAYTGEYTRFYFNTPTESVSRMTLKIFTLSGQLVRQFNDVQPGVKWDLKDQRGNRLSPNVYLYRLYVEREKRPDNTNFSTGSDKEIIHSKIRKMVIYPPR